MSCGYLGHVCHGVQFISGPPFDYCVDGKRIALGDDGKPRNGTPSEQERLRLHLLDKYADYLTWRAEWLHVKFPFYEAAHEAIRIWKEAR